MTEWWAFKPVTTAYGKVKKLLLEPFNAWTWIKLMVIVFFVGAGASKLSSSYSNLFNYRTGGGYGTYYDFNQEVQNILSNGTLVTLIIGLIILAVIVALIFTYLRNVFSFVFVKAVASGDVHVIKPMFDNVGRGFNLFIFTLAVSILTAIIDLILIGAIVLGVFLIIKVGTASAASIIIVLLAAIVMIILLLLLIAFSIAMGIFLGFTYDFVTPMVLFKNMGVRESWRHLWGSIKKDWQQYTVYVVTRWIVEIVVGILMLFIVLPVALIFIAILVIGGIMAFAIASTAIWLSVVIGLVLLVVFLIFILVMLAISTPVAVYFRYYSLDVLKQIDPSAVVYAEKFIPPTPPPALSA